MMQRKRVIVGSLGLALVCLSGCSKPSTTTEAPTPGAQTNPMANSTTTTTTVTPSKTTTTKTTVKTTLSDAQFAKKAFNLLAQGNMAVENMIDWENFESAGMKIGPTYKSMPDDTQKAGFRKGFISSFSKSFHAAGGREASLKNWRLKSQSGGKSIVIADTVKKTIMSVTVSKQGGKQKFASIN